MHEHHKKAHKKEEKKSATEAKKKEMKGKEEGEKAKKAHKKKKEEEKEHEEEKKKHKMMEQHHDHDHEESAVSSTRLQGVRAQKDHDQDEGDELGDRQPQSASPQMLTVSSTLRPSVVAIMPTYRSSNSSPITTTTTSTTQSPNRLVQRYTAKRIASANPMQQTPLPGSLTRLFQVGHDNVQFPGVARRSPSNLPQLFKVEQNNTRDSYRLVGRRSDETRQVPAQHSTTSVNNPQNAIPTTSDSPQTRPTANDATLLDIINRLNTSRSDRNSQESSYNYHHNHDNNKNELANLSPMLRLVSNLARLDQRRAMGRSNTHQPQQQPPPVVDPKPSPIVNKLSFNPQASMPTFVSPTTITTTIRPSVQPLRQQAIATTATTTSKNLHDLVGHHHSDHSNANRNHLAEYPLGPRLMPPPYDGLSVNSPSASTNQQEADQVSVFDQAALASGPQQPPQQYYMAPLTGSIPEHRPLALDPTFSFIDQSLVDYDSPSLASEYHQRQQQQLLSSLLMQQQSLVVQPGGLQRNFDFLTDR